MFNRQKEICAKGSDSVWVVNAIDNFMNANGKLLTPFDYQYCCGRNRVLGIKHISGLRFPFSTYLYYDGYIVWATVRDTFWVSELDGVACAAGECTFLFGNFKQYNASIYAPQWFLKLDSRYGNSNIGIRILDVAVVRENSVVFSNSFLSIVFDVYSLDSNYIFDSVILLGAGYVRFPNSNLKTQREFIVYQPGTYRITFRLDSVTFHPYLEHLSTSNSKNIIHYIWLESEHYYGGNSFDSSMWIGVDSSIVDKGVIHVFRNTGIDFRSTQSLFMYPVPSNTYGHLVLRDLQPMYNGSLAGLYVGYSSGVNVLYNNQLLSTSNFIYEDDSIPGIIQVRNNSLPSTYGIFIMNCPKVNDSLFLSQFTEYQRCSLVVHIAPTNLYGFDLDYKPNQPDTLGVILKVVDKCRYDWRLPRFIWDTILPTYDQFCGDLTVSVPVPTEGVELWAPSGQVAFIDTTIGTYQLPDTGTYWLRLYDTIGCYIGWSDTFHVWKVGIDSFLLGYEEFCGSVELFGLSDFDISYYVYRDTLLYLVDTATLFNVDSPGTYIVMLLDSATCRYAQTDPINVEYAGVDTFDIPFDLDCEALVLPDSLSDEQWYVIKDTVFVGVFTGGVVPVSESGIYYLWAMDSSVCRYYRSGGSFVEVMQYDTLLLPVSYQCGNLWVSGGDTLSGRYYLVYEGDTVYVSDSSSFWIDSAGLYWVVYIDTTGCVVGYSDSVLVRRSEVSYPLTIRYSEGVLYVEGVKDVSNVVLYSTSGSVGSVPVLVFSSGVCELCPEKPKHRFKVSDLAPGVYVAEIVTKKGNRFYKKVIVR